MCDLYNSFKHKDSKKVIRLQKEREQSDDSIQQQSSPRSRAILKRIENTTLDLQDNNSCIQDLIPQVLVSNKKYQLLQQTYSSLQNLKLDGCKLSTDQVSQVLLHFYNYKHLKILHLSRNKIGDLAIWRQFDQLNELYLHWNLTTGEGAARILDTTNLKLLDLSCNRIGKQRTEVFIRSFRKRFNAFRHLEQWTYESTHRTDRDEFTCKPQFLMISQNNKTLIGLHLQGEHDYCINQLGFLQQRKQKVESQPYIQFTSRINGFKAMQNFFQDDDDQKDICWICSGFKQQQFSYVDRWNKIEKLFLILKNHQPIPMMKDQQTFLVDLVCEIQTKYHFIDLSGNKYHPELCMPNVIFQPIVDDEYRINISLNIRNQQYLQKQKQKIGWNINDSIFKEEIFDYQLMLEDCYDMDSKQSTSILSNQEGDVIHQNYPKIFALFAYLHILQFDAFEEMVQKHGLVNENGPLDIKQLRKIIKQVTKFHGIEIQRHHLLDILLKIARYQSQQDSTYSLITFFNNSIFNEFEFSFDFKQTDFWLETTEKLINHYNLPLEFYSFDDFRQSVKQIEDLMAKIQPISYSLKQLQECFYSTIIKNFALDPVEITSINQIQFWECLFRLIAQTNIEKLISKLGAVFFILYYYLIKSFKQQQFQQGRKSKILTKNKQAPVGFNADTLVQKVELVYRLAFKSSHIIPQQTIFLSESI